MSLYGASSFVGSGPDTDHSSSHELEAVSLVGLCCRRRPQDPNHTDKGKPPPKELPPKEPDAADCIPLFWGFFFGYLLVSPVLTILTCVYTGLAFRDTNHSKWLFVMIPLSPLLFAISLLLWILFYFPGLFLYSYNVVIIRKYIFEIQRFQVRLFCPFVNRRYCCCARRPVRVSSHLYYADEDGEEHELERVESGSLSSTSLSHGTPGGG